MTHRQRRRMVGRRKNRGGGVFVSKVGCGWWLNIYLRWLTNQPPSPIYIYTQRSGLINWSNTLRWFFIAALSFFPSFLPSSLPHLTCSNLPWRVQERRAPSLCGCASPKGRVTRFGGGNMLMDRDSGWLWHMRDMQKSDSDVENSIHKWRKSKEAPRECECEEFHRIVSLTLWPQRVIIQLDSLTRRTNVLWFDSFVNKLFAEIITGSFSAKGKREREEATNKFISSSSGLARICGRKVENTCLRHRRILLFGW